jgi:peptidyl-prolyl cis-trans isomerase C
MTLRPLLRRAAFCGSTLALLGLAVMAGPALADDAAAPAAAAAAPAAAPAPAVDPKAVVATIDGQPITEADLALAEQDFSEELSKVPADQRRRSVLDVLIDLRLMANAATKAGLDKSDEFQRRAELLRDRALRAEFFRAEVDEKVTDEAVKKRYDEEIAKVTPADEVEASHILVDTEDQAKAVIAELDKGADFAALAKEKSKDPGSAKMGGQLGYFAQGKMVKEFEDAAFALDVGQYTKTPVKTQYGYHVIKVTGKRKQPLPTFDQVKEQVRQLVLRDTFVNAVAQLRKDSKVEVLDPALKAQEQTPAAQ